MLGSEQVFGLPPHGLFAPNNLHNLSLIVKELSFKTNIIF